MFNKQNVIIFVLSNKELIDMLNKNELKELIDHEIKNLTFYALFFDELKGSLSMDRLEKQIDFHLDRLIDLLEKLKN